MDNGTANGQPIDVATLGSADGTPVTRSVPTQLTALFAAVLDGYTNQALTIQITVDDPYAIGDGPPPAPIPVLLPPRASTSLAARPFPSDIIGRAIVLPES